MVICTGVPCDVHASQNTHSCGQARSGLEHNSKQSALGAESTQSDNFKTLLDLPAEIRNAIYHEVLGRQKYHVYAHASKSTSAGPINGSRSNTCSETKTYLYRCVIHKHDPKLEWLDEHLSCFVDGHAGLPNVALLRVCRQVYHEAALIPYAANSFIFIAPPSFEKFTLEVLSMERVRALREIEIWSPMGTLPLLDEEISWKYWALPRQISEANLFAGLKYLTLNFSIYDEAIVDQVDEAHKLLDLGMVAGRLLKGVDVNVTLNEAGRPEGEPEVDVKGILGHIEKLKNTLMVQRRAAILA